MDMQRTTCVFQSSAIATTWFPSNAFIQHLSCLISSSGPVCRRSTFSISSVVESQLRRVDECVIEKLLMEYLFKEILCSRLFVGISIVQISFGSHRLDYIL